MPTAEQHPSPDRGNAATGLVFVGIVLTALFASGIGGVVATRPPQPASPPAATADRPAAARFGVVSAAAPSTRRAVAATLAQLVGQRDAALSSRDATLLARVYAGGCANRRYDQAAIAGLLRDRQRWLGLRSTVRVLQATQTGARRWTLVAAVSRAPARLVTEAGRPVRAVPTRRQVLRFTMLWLPRGERWALLGIASAGG
ncbi:MAG TPA: hypothetical protein VGM21_17665 [Actinomycetota bacterium]|jgi:hypothetical protein